jgi:predicted dehydrogenase
VWSELLEDAALTVRIGVVGAGHMPRDYHCPSLAHLAALAPPRVELVAVCDLDRAKASFVADRFGFAHAYSSLDEMLAGSEIDAVCVITPLKATCEVATAVMRHRKRVMMEKPPGASHAETTRLAEVSKKTGIPAMVATNRRFVPALVEARRLAALAGRATYFEAVQLRARRVEDGFVYGTGLHVIDAIRFLGGDVRRVETTVRRLPGEEIETWSAWLDFSSGASGRVLIKPQAGSNVERFTISGPEFTIMAGGGTDWLADYPGTIESHVGGTCTRPELPRNALAAPERIYWSGFFGEMLEFVDSVAAGRTPSPTVEEVAQSVRLSEMIQAGRSGDL